MRKGQVTQAKEAARSPGRWSEIPTPQSSYVTRLCLSPLPTPRYSALSPWFCGSESGALSDTQQIMDRKYKPLLPALKTPGGRSEPNEQSSAATKRKRMYVKKACDICRIKKTACDGQRPACTPCTKRKSPCTFSGRSAESEDSRSPGPTNITNEADSASIVTALLTAHDAEAHELLTRMRQGRGTLEVLGSEEETDKAPILLPPDQTSVEFELMIRHPVAYPALMALDSHSQNSSCSEQIQMAGAQASEPGQKRDGEDGYSDGTDLGPSGHGAYEARLRQVHFARWTDNPISGSEAAIALANYLAHDHMVLNFFDHELFLRDLSDGDGDYCSSLLVNALLGWALLGIATMGSDNLELARLAFNSAINQLESQKDRPHSLSTLAAVELLSLTALFQGQGARSSSLLRLALSMGQKVGLFLDMHDPAYLGGVLFASTGEDSARATASWGLFSFATMLSFHCQRNELAPSLVPAHVFPESETRGPLQGVAAIPKYLSRLWKLVHEINFHYYDGIGSFKSEITVPFVSSVLGRLLQWSDELPVALARGNRSTHEIMIMHVYLHAAIMTLVYPLVLRQDSSALVEGESADRSAEAFYAASAAQMHRLVDIHHSRPRISTSSVFWHTSLLLSANSSIRNSNGAFLVRRRRFLRAMDGYADLFPQYPVMQVIFRGLMTMAVDVGLVGSQEAVRLARRLAEKGEGTSAVAGEEPTEACFIVDLELALEDRGMAHVDRLSQRFDEIVMFDDFVHENPGI